MCISDLSPGGVDIEGFGISFIEASCKGVAVIAGDSGGVRPRYATVRPVFSCRLTTSTPSPRTPRILAIRSGVIVGPRGTRAVETHFNWDRGRAETAAFASAPCAA